VDHSWKQQTEAQPRLRHWLHNNTISASYAKNPKLRCSLTHTWLCVGRRMLHRNVLCVLACEYLPFKQNHSFLWVPGVKRKLASSPPGISKNCFLSRCWVHFRVFSFVYSRYSTRNIKNAALKVRSFIFAQDILFFEPQTPASHFASRITSANHSDYLHCSANIKCEWWFRYIRKGLL
jgi:hypothetical protein